MISGTTAATHALRVLEIAPRFIDIRKKNIFVYSANASAYALVDILKDDAIWRSEDPKSAIEASIAKHHAQMELYQKQKEHLRELISKRQEVTSTPEATRVALRELQTQLDMVEPKTLPIADYEWAVACKLIMQQAKILSDTPKVKEALRSLLEHIQTIQMVTGSEIFKKGAAFLRIDGQCFQELLLNFMGKLCLANELDSVRVIHQYFRLGQLALAHSDVNELDVTKIGMTLAPGLFQSLDLFGHVLPRSGDEAQDVLADAKEYACFKIIMKELVMIREFSLEFNPAAYHPYLKPEDLLKPAAATSTQPRDMMLRLREMSLNEGDPLKRDKKDALRERSASNAILPGYALIGAMTKGSSGPENGDLTSSSKRKTTPREGN